MKSVEEYIEMYRSSVQAAVPDEQVLAVGALSRPGAMAGVLTAHVSGAMYMAQKAKGKKLAAGLPASVLAAATPTRVLFFDYRPKMSSIKLNKLVMAIPREGLHLAFDQGSLATRVTFTYPDGSGFQLDSNRSIGQYQRFNDALFTVLTTAGHPSLPQQWAAPVVR